MNESEIIPKHNTDMCFGQYEKIMDQTVIPERSYKLL